jgi:hypothetical protein
MLKDLIGPVSSLIGEFIEDKDKANQLAHDVATMAQEHAHDINKGQIEINKTEAAHKSLFVAGWRPAVGWVCVLGMFSNYFIIPITNFILALVQSEIVVPLLDTSEMLTLLGGLLALGGYRTVEKIKGVQRER